MAIHLYNTASRQREELTPAPPGPLRMYVCGPTVYNYIHIGNARVFIVFDVIRRHLRKVGYQVKYVQNFTDFDDRLLAVAEREGRSVREIADRYIEAYFADMDALGVERADIHPRAADHVQGMMEAISVLLRKKIAYVSAGDVYFCAGNYPGYGQLAQQPLEELRVGARVAPNKLKKEPLDFALWKAAPREELGWEAPWGYGRPGWHMECSVMIRHYLGDVLDIHGGGEDLCFPHHENERVQSEAWTGKSPVRYWLHNAFVLLQGKKMAKSVGNTLMVQELRQQYDPLVLRYLLLAVHYRRPLQLSEEALFQAKTSVARFCEAIQNLRARLRTEVDVATPSDDDMRKQEELAALSCQFHTAMGDDFHTANAMDVLFAAVRLLNGLLARTEVSRSLLLAVQDWFVTHAGEVLGLMPPAPALVSDEIQQYIEEREQARAQGDYAQADHIRTQLRQQGIVLEDTPQGVRWKRL